MADNKSKQTPISNNSTPPNNQTSDKKEKEIPFTETETYKNYDKWQKERYHGTQSYLQLANQFKHDQGAYDRIINEMHEKYWD